MKDNKKILIIRADDYGLSAAINRGIEKVLKNGLTKNVGVMINLEDVKDIRNLLDKEIDIGLHCNITIGKPISSKDDIPSLVDENGVFLSSSYYRNNKGKDAELKDVETEIENQVEAFKDLLGFYPKYMDVHAVASQNFLKGTENVAAKKNILYIDTAFKGNTIVVKENEVYFAISNPLKKLNVNNRNINILVTHPGYVDKKLKNRSSLTYLRILELIRYKSASAKRKLKEYKIERFSDEF